MHSSVSWHLKKVFSCGTTMRSVATYVYPLCDLLSWCPPLLGWSMHGVSCSYTKNYFGRGIGLETPSPLSLAKRLCFAYFGLDRNVHIQYQEHPGRNAYMRRDYLPINWTEAHWKENGAHPYMCWTVYTPGIFDMWVSVVYVVLRSNNFVFRNTRQAIEAIRGTDAVGNIVLSIGGMDGRDTVIPTRIVIPTVILTSC